MDFLFRRRVSDEHTRQRSVRSEQRNYRSNLAQPCGLPSFSPLPALLAPGVWLDVSDGVKHSWSYVVVVAVRLARLLFAFPRDGCPPVDWAGLALLLYP